MTRSLACALLAIAATLVACVDLSQPLILQQGTGGDQGGATAFDAAAGGSGGATTSASGGSGGIATTGGTRTGGTTSTGGAGGSVALDAGTARSDDATDAPSSPDVSLPSDRATGGSVAGTTGSGGGSGGTGQAGSAGGGQTSTGGTVVAGAGGGGTAGQASSAVGGTGGASSTATGGAGATGGTTTATGGATTPTCTPVPKSTGGLSCPSGLCTVGAYSGYDFTFADPTGQSSVCMLPTSLCGAGTVGAQNPPSYTVWGAGFGFSLSLKTTPTTEVPVQLSGSGVTVKLSSLPTNADMRLQVKHFVGATGTTYCAIMTTASQTVLWTSFNTMCWDPTKGVALTGAPNTSNIQFQASSRATAGSFDFCVTALSFQ